MQETSKNKILFVFICTVIFWFLFLCLLNYFAGANRVDEPEVLNNLKELTPLQLFGELKYNQVFPRAYLVLISLFSSYFSYSLLSARFFPLLFMILGFFLWIYLYKQESKTTFFLFLLIFSFTSSVFTTDYAAYLKQYSCDLFVIAVFTLFIYFQKKYIHKEISIRPLWLFSLFTPILIIFSQMSFLLFWVIIYNYLFLFKENKKIRLPFILYTLLAMASCVILYYIDIRYSLRVTFMQWYWKNYFVDTSSLYGFLKTFTNGLQNLMVRWFLEKRWAKIIATLFMPFALVAMGKSFWVSFKENKGKIFDINSICLILLVELFILGVFKIYPFTGARVTLFIAPFIFYMIVRGIYLTKKIKFLFFSLLSTYILFLTSVSCYLLFYYLDFYK